MNYGCEGKVAFISGGTSGIGKAVADVEKALAGRGRVLLRYSGTEALCRVMVEAEDEDKVVRYARDLADVVSRELLVFCPLLEELIRSGSCRGRPVTCFRREPCPKHSPVRGMR